ncbi:hypothetical protein Patl1_23136 [Pistacia atlantica]|uniref:Uncharacterized protein n=1 Tax=Pistacia atlantica TaxID=434234 RepID=A0ACC0ZY43_9ROSI|nr:hypothetical protein Patl1_23136 [Pistacia atlantica]
MKKVGYGDVDIIVGETDWPSAGDLNQSDSNLQNALWYIGNLVKHVNSGEGTPLMPNQIFEVYIFALFNENLKPSISEQNFGLFKPESNNDGWGSTGVARRALRGDGGGASDSEANG